MTLKIITADYHNPAHRKALTTLLNEYACDPMGGGHVLEESVLEALPDALASTAGAVTFLADDDQQFIGLLNAFRGFSTFRAKPLLNIHDVYVAPKFRGIGISHHLLQAAEQHALETNCCKMTLEVLSGNTSAQASYRRFGFHSYSLDAETGTALFWEKSFSAE